MLYLVLGLVLLVGSYFLFRDTMNKLQYIQTLRVYWITRNTGIPGTPVLCRGDMRGTSYPWWRGKGIQFRAGKYIFQIGVLTGKSDGLLEQLGGRHLDADPKEIRSW